VGEIDPTGSSTETSWSVIAAENQWILGTIPQLRESEIELAKDLPDRYRSYWRVALGAPFCVTPPKQDTVKAL
jgi:hypothetical protein